MPYCLRLRAGDPLDETITLRDLAGRAREGVWDGADLVSARLWPGDDRPLIEGVVEAEWVDADAATVLLSAEGVDTADLVAGTYPVEVLVNGSLAWEGRLEVLTAPGVSTTPLAYGTAAGVRRLAGGWLERLQGEGEQSGFAEELGDAREWTDRQVVARARYTLERWYGGDRGDPEATDLLTATEDAVDGVADSSSPALIRLRLAAITTSLDDDDALVIDDAIRKSNEHYAASLVLGRILPGKDEGNATIMQMAAWHRSRANSLLNASTFGIDTDDDGEADYTLSPC